MVLEIFNTAKKCIGKIENSKITDSNGQVIGYADKENNSFLDENKNVVAHIKQSNLYTKSGRSLCLFTNSEIRDSMNQLFIRIDGERILDNKNYLKGYVKGEIEIPKNVALAALLIIYTIDLFWTFPYIYSKSRLDKNNLDSFLKSYRLPY